MSRGLNVKDAVMDACKRIATTSVRDPKRRRPDGKTTFNVWSASRSMRISEQFGDQTRTAREPVH